MRFAISIVLGILALSVSGCGGNAGASPAQPIAFPHKLHADNQIDCAFCHEFYDRHAAAGIPRTELCGACHMAMPQESEATQKLMEYVDAEEPIPWVRLYKLPQFTYFPHKWHVRAGLSCETCHADIGQSMTAVRHQVLKMKWCIECHEQEQVSVDCVVCHK
ncbi:MAG: menaquinol oxidoreductase [Acidobacteria bacterium]|nr:MAG: menaquinol oxidoreductase [Acidobacteriota bacterium]